ncbi:hypothetical protein K492DRAFT_108231, partial [Lichtheimia hyalospora FSU 10163]
PLVKDDVFLAAPSIINDNESVITTNSSNDDGSSNSSAAAAPNSTVGWAPTPCLSPVTSPSDFLCNHEPLFDGIEDLQQQQQHKHAHNSNYFDDNDDTQINSNITNDDHPASETKRESSKDNIPVLQRLHQDEQDGVHRTIFERLTHAGIDWCRYCGTTEGVNWRPGPWGKRTLCNKHGCDYKGYGIASRLPRLDLSAFTNEKLEDRRRPVVQQFCVVCQKPESTNDNKLIPCEGGCSRAYHQQCRIPAITTAAYQDQQWCCSTVCRENRKRNKV